MISTLNMNFVPRPVYGMLQVSIMADGHFGSTDPVNWPQVMQIDTKYPWLSVIQRRPTDPKDAHFPMWQVLKTDDFIPLSTSASFSTISPAALDCLRPVYSECLAFVAKLNQQHGPNGELEWLSSMMRYAFSRLTNFLLSFCDLVCQHACLQCYWLYTVAWLDWYIGYMCVYPLCGNISYVPLPTDQLMGCLTTIPQIAQRLFWMGILVWFLCTVEYFTEDDVLERCVDLQEPINILDFPSTKKRDAYTVQLTGLISHIVFAGDRNITWINHQAQ